jgi:cell wall assembly regulator SMI1
MSSPVGVLLQQMIQDLRLQRPPGATDQQLQEFEAKTKLTLPDSLKELYRISNGLVLEEGALKLHTLDEALQYPKWFFRTPWGYVPLVDNNDSNPWCVCCKPPLHLHVVQVMHDDDSELKFRSLESFLTAMPAFAKSKQWILDDLPGDFDGPKRTPEDIQRGKELLAMADDIANEDRQEEAVRFGNLLCGQN